MVMWGICKPILLKRGRTVITTSWDDGHPLDVKLCSMLKRYSIQGTIYTPITNWENEVMSVEQLKEISKDFEIGGHTFNHTILTTVSEERISSELAESKTWLEEITGKEVISFCYPRGQYNSLIIDKVRNAGFKGSRTAELFRTSFSRQYECHTTVQAVDRIMLSRGKQILTTDNHALAAKLLFSGQIFHRWDVIAKSSLDYVLENGGIWHLWGHSWEINRNGDWELLEAVLEYARENGRRHGAEFVTNGRIFNEHHT